MSDMTKEEFDGRKELCDERFKRDGARLANLEESMQNLTKLVTQLSEIVKVNTTDAADREARLRLLEMKPAKQYDALWGFVVGAIVSGAIGALIKYLF